MAPKAETNPATRRVALYLRVSTNNGQTTENQAIDLESDAGTIPPVSAGPVPRSAGFSPHR